MILNKCESPSSRIQKQRYSLNSVIIGLPPENTAPTENSIEFEILDQNQNTSKEQIQVLKKPLGSPDMKVSETI